MVRQAKAVLEGIKGKSFYRKGHEGSEGSIQEEGGGVAAKKDI